MPLAAMQASTEEAPGIAGADFVILDVAGLSARAASLGYGAALDQITNAIVDDSDFDLGEADA